MTQGDRGKGEKYKSKGDGLDEGVKEGRGDDDLQKAHKKKQRRE